RQAELRLEDTIEGVTFEILFQQPLATSKTQARVFYCQRRAICETQALYAEYRVAGLNAQPLDSLGIGHIHARREHLCTWVLPARADILGESRECHQLLGDLVAGDKRALALLAVEYAFVDKLGDRLARRHATYAVGFAELALRRNEVAG